MAKTKKNTDHLVYRNSNLFCSNCGREQVIPYPIAVDMISAMYEAFKKAHKNCKKVWQQPEVDLKTSINERIEWWKQHGERGISSESIFSKLSGQNILKHYGSEPCDPGDFRRCYMLIKAIPEWRDELHKMREESTAWSNIIDNWDKLSEMLEEQMETKQTNGMYDFMQQLLEKK